MNNKYQNSTAIFIVGNSRSGTTMMSRILGQAAPVYTFNEIHFFGNIIGAGKEFDIIQTRQAILLFATLLSAQYEGIFRKRNPSKYLPEAASIIDKSDKKQFSNADVYRLFVEYLTSKNEKLIPCKQTPYYIFYFNEIIKIFPSALVINMIRDPRDILLSQKRRWKRKLLGARYVPYKESFRTWMNYHPITISRLWNASQLTAMKIKNERFISIRFEDLIENPEKTISSICQQLGLSFGKDMLNIPVVGSSTEVDNGLNIGIDKTKRNRWINGGLNKTEIYLCQKICKNFLIANNYPKIECKPYTFSLIFYYITFPIKLLFAIMLNLSRIKNIQTIIKRKFILL